MATRRPPHRSPAPRRPSRRPAARSRTARTRKQRQRRGIQVLLLVAVALWAAGRLLAWIAAHPWIVPVVLAAAAAGGVLWHRYRAARSRRRAETARTLRYPLEQLDRLHHREFEHAVRDLMFRDGCADAVQVGVPGTTAPTSRPPIPTAVAGYCSASTAGPASPGPPWEPPTSTSSTAPAAPSTRATSSYWSPTAASPGPPRSSPDPSACTWSTARPCPPGRADTAPCGNSCERSRLRGTPRPSPDLSAPHSRAGIRASPRSGRNRASP